MRSIGLRPSPWTFRWAAGMALIAAVGCREEMQSPNPPESAPATSATPAALELAAVSNTWTLRAGIPDRHSGYSVSALENAAGQWIVYVFGGHDPDLETGESGWRYDVVTNTWDGAPNSFIDATDLNGVARIGTKFYITGGESCCDIDFRTFNTTLVYNSSTGALVRKADMPKATVSGVTGAINGKVYVLPGFCNSEPVDPGHCTTPGQIRQLYRYDPSTNTWTTRRQAPHFHNHGGAAVINDKFYVVGGINDGAYLDVYDPATNTWQTRAPIPTPGEQLFGAAIDSKFFVLSWSHPSGQPIISKAYLYDPATNKWASRAAPPGGSSGPIVKVVLNGQPRLFLPGGGPSYLYTP